MEIIRAENSGFCFGVRKALEITEEEIEAQQGRSGKIYTCGPLIHNRDVTDYLARRGCGILEDPLAAEDGDTLIIRSHGEPKSFFDRLAGRDIRLVDATCPFVKRIHELVREADEAGKRIIIVGDALLQQAMKDIKPLPKAELEKRKQEKLQREAEQRRLQLEKSLEKMRAKYKR